MLAPYSPARPRDRVRAPAAAAAASVSQQPAMQPRVARYMEHLREASIALGLDVHGCTRRTSFGSPSVAEACPFEPLKVEMKRSKFAFTDADMKESLIKGCAQSSSPWVAVDQSRKDLWVQDKEHNKEFKTARIQEEEVHKQLHASITEAYDAALEAQRSGSMALDLLNSQQDGAELAYHMGEGEDLDLCPPWANGPHNEAAGETMRGLHELQRVTSAGQQEAQKRNLLEAEVQRWELQLKQAKARKLHYQQQHKEAKDCADSLDKINKAQIELGFPSVTFNEAPQRGDTSECRIVLSGPGTSADEAIRTVNVVFGKDGELTHATPHLSLGMQREADESVKRDDLPRLLTMVWHRICDGKRRKPSRGGA